MRTRITTIATAAVLGVTTALVAAGPAKADPYDCYATAESYYGHALCRAGSGTYRVILRCDKSFAPDYNRYGPSVAVGRVSPANCNASDRAYAPTWQVTRI